jgi:hypothetical protein
MSRRQSPLIRMRRAYYRLIICFLLLASLGSLLLLDVPKERILDGFILLIPHLIR